MPPGVLVIALTTLSNVLVGGFDGTPGSNNVEVALDIEMVMAMAPGAHILVYQAPNSGAGVLQMLNHMATDNQARQLSAFDAPLLLHLLITRDFAVGMRHRLDFLLPPAQLLKVVWGKRNKVRLLCDGNL